MSTVSTTTPLRQRMIENMAARKLGRHLQRSHIESCKRFAIWLISAVESPLDDLGGGRRRKGKKRTS